MQDPTRTIEITTEPVGVSALLLNMAIGVGLALLLKWHFERYARTLGNRREFAANFTIILLTTTLVISIVKSSLALSLGLVGALSIVRFRTPIKEPEELAYLFLAIAAGLGLGANQPLLTVPAVLLILATLAILRSRRPALDDGRHLFLSVRWSGGAERSHSLDHLSGIVGRHAQRNDMRRVDVGDSGIDATFLVDVASADRLSALLDELRSACPGAEITLLDQNRMPAV